MEGDAALTSRRVGRLEKNSVSWSVL